MSERKKTRVRRKNMGVRKVLLILILIFIAIQLVRMIVPAAITFSRYVYSKVRSYYFATQEFYFTSDKLASGNGAYFETSNWSGVGNYDIRVNILTKNNSNEGTSVDVPYTITATYEVCNKDGVPYANPADYVTFYLSKNSGRVEVSANNKDYFDISVTKTERELNDDDYIKIYVTAESQSPYIETLKGEFKIGIINLGMSHQIDDKPYDPYCSVTVTNTRDYYVVDTAFGGYAKDQSISIDEYLALSDADKAKCSSMNVTMEIDPREVVLDTTSEVYLTALEQNLVNYTTIDGFSYINKIQLHVDAEESRVVKFYKKDISKDYTYPNTNGEGPVVTVLDLNPNR